MELSGNCPICDALVTREQGVEESEILSCPECRTQLVVDRVEEASFHLSEAPAIEEDWGE